MRYRLYKWFWKGIDLLFPPVCAGCGVPGTRWCQECHQKIRIIEPPYCSICGQNLHAEGICDRCRENTPRINAIRSWALFKGPLRNALHRLKYQKDLGLGDVFTESLIEVLLGSTWQINLITPVPLGIAREKERGYNQASLIAKPIALRMKIPYSSKAVTRTKETLSQVELTREQRRENVANAFLANPETVKGKKVLLVDDVATSGSTLDSCADALFRAGALNVFGLTLARAEFFQ